MLKSIPRAALRHSSSRYYYQTTTPSHTIPRVVFKSYSKMANLNLTIPSLKLNDGASIPMLGYGVGTAWGKKDESKIDQAIVDAVKMAIGLGYYHLDGAQSYKNETELGRGIKESGVDRSKLFVTTKIAEPTGQPGNIEGTLKESLKKLQLDYVDLYLIHSPFWAKSEQDLQSTWAEMEALQQSGLAKTIGVSNYRPQDLEAVLKTAKVKPAVNQIEFHPYLQRIELLEFHKKHGIATTAYG